MDNIARQTLQELVSLDFSGRGEEFVEARFITPLLACLGYETHRDYEVIRHGDEGSAFKLQYPPVEKGAKRVKHYNPDYVPTIRKKMFWIIEAKSPREAYPFETKYLVQGLQYCIHPEIQAKYLLVTNGAHSALYDAHGAVFFEKEIYEPIFEFTSSEIIGRWQEIFNLLSVERLRLRIETDLRLMYDKLCLSSLDRSYPARLIRDIGVFAGKNAQLIENNARRLYLEGINMEAEAWLKAMEQMDCEAVFSAMDAPLTRGGGRSEARYFIEKCLANDVSAAEIFQKLTADFDAHRIFRKEQSFIAICHLFRRVEDESVKLLCREFLDRHKDGQLPLLSQVECADLRLTRKISVLNVYKPLREKLAEELKTASELVRFVNPPTALALMYPIELARNQRQFAEIRSMSEEQLRSRLTDLLAVEEKIDAEFWKARAALSDDEWQVAGFETYGDGGKHYRFKNILINLGLEPRSNA